MSKTVDDRIVQMKFDNGQFESGVKQSMSTLDKLKKALKFEGAADGFNKIDAAANNVNFNGMSSAIETVGTKFNALEAIAFGALAKIGSQAIEAGEKIVKSLSVDQLAAGWSKYESKTTSSATLVAQGFEQGKVNEVLKKLNWYTDETSYNLTDMISNISKFTASGKDLDDSATAMMGIANWAALSGQNAAKASQAMYQLSQAMGKGALRYDDWKSIQNASMDTKEFREQAVKAAEELGVLKKEGEDTYTILADKSKASLNDLFTSDYLTRKAWFSDQVMMKVFTNYSAAVDQIYDYTQDKNVLTSGAIEALNGQVDEFGMKAFRAAQEARTWTDALDSVKDAVSTGWMNTFEILFGDSTEATSFFTDMANNLWDLFAAGAEERNDFLAEVMGDPWQEVVDRLNAGGVSMEDFQNRLSAIASKNGINLNNVIEAAGGLKEAFQNGEISSKVFIDTLDSFTKSEKEVVETTLDLKDAFDKIMRGELGTGQKRWDKLTEAGYDYRKVQDLVNRHMAGEKLNWDEIAAAQQTNVELTKEQIEAQESLREQFEQSGMSVEDFVKSLQKKSGRALLLESIVNSIKGMVTLLGTVKDAFNSFIPEDIGDRLYNILEKVHGITEGFELYTETTSEAGEVTRTYTDTGEKLLSMFKGVFAVFDLVGYVIGEVVKGFVTILQHLGFVKDGFLSAGAGAGEALQKFNKWVKDSGMVTKAVKAVTDVIIKFIDVLRDSGADIGKFFDFISRTKPFINLRRMFSGELTGSTLKFTNNLNRSADALKRVREIIVNIVTKLKLGEKIKSLSETFSNLSFEKVTGFFDKVSRSITDFFLGRGVQMGSGGGLFTGVESVGDIFEKAKEKVVGAVEKMKESAGGFFGWIKTAASKVNWDAVALFAGLAGGLFGVIKLSDALTAIGGVFEPFAKLAKSVEVGFKEIATSLRLFQTNLRATIIIKVAIAIGILVAAIAALAYVAASDKFDLTKAVTYIIGITVALMGLTIALAVLQKFSKGTAGLVTASLLFLAAAIALIVYSLIKLDGYDFNHIYQSATALLIIAGVLALIAVLMSKTAPQMISGGSGVLAFSLSIIILMEAMKKMAKMSLRTVLKGIMGLIPIIVTLGIISALMGVTGGIGIRNAIGLIIFCLSITTFMRILEKIAKNDTFWETIKSGIKNVIACIGLLTIVSFAAGKTAGANWGALIASALLMLAFVFSIKQLGDYPTAKLIKGVAAIGVVIWMLFGLFGSIAKVSSNLTQDENKQLVTVLGETIILVVMISLALSYLATIDGKALNSARSALSMVFVTIGIMLKLSSTISKNAVAPMFMAILAIGAVTAALIAISKWGGDTDKILAAALGISLCLVAIGTCLLIMEQCTNGRELGKKKMGAFALAILAVVAIGLAMSAIAYIGGSWQNIIASAVGIGLCMLALSFAVNQMTKMKPMPKRVTNGDIARNITSVLLPTVLALGLLGAVMASTGASPLDVISAAVAISIVMPVIVKTLQMMSNLKLKPTGGDLFVEAILMLIPVCLAIGLLSRFGGEASKMIAASVAIGVLLVTLSFSLAVLNDVPPINEAAAVQILVAAFALLPICLAINMIAQFDFVQLIGSVIAMGLMLAVLVGSLVVLSAVPYPAVLSGLAALGTVAIALAALVALFGALYNIDGAEQLMADGGRFLQLIGEAIGKFVGGIIGGGIEAVGDSITNLLPRLGQSLSDFMANGKDFFDEIKDIDPSALGTVAAIAGMIIALGAAEVLDVATKLLSFGGKSPLVKMGETLSDFAPHVGKFLDEFEGRDLSNVGPAIKAIAEIIGLAHLIPNEGGLLGKVFGENGLGDFGKGLWEFGRHFVKFARSMSTITDFAPVTNAAAAMTEVVKFAKDIPNEGGMWADFWGDNKMDVFGEELCKFGESIVKYAEIVSALTEDDVAAIKRSASAGLEVIKLAKNIDNQGGILADLLGDNTLAVFVENDTLQKFGNALISYIEIVRPITKADVKSVKLSVKAAEGLVSLAQKIPDMGGLIEQFTGASDLGTFGTNLRVFGSGLKGFYESVNDIDVSRIDVVSSCVSGLISVSGSVKKRKLFSGEESLETFGQRLVTFGQSLKAYDEILSQTTPAHMESASRAIIGIVEAFNNASTINQTDTDYLATAMHSIGDAIADMTNNLDFSASVETIGNAFELMMNGPISAVENAKPKLKYAMLDAVTTMVISIKEKIPLAESMMTSLIEKCVAKLKEKQAEFKEAGQFAVDGFIKGLKDPTKLSEISAAGTTIGNLALNAAKKSLQEKSPSRAMAKVGVFAVQGFVNGITKVSGLAEIAAKEMAEDSLNATKKSVYGFNSLFDDTDLNPTITPVMDLSNIQNGVNAMHSLLNTSPIYGAMNGFNSVQAYNASVSTPNIEDIVNRVADRYSSDLKSAIGEAKFNVQTNVALQGDAAGVFNLVRSENTRLVKTTGNYYLAPGVAPES